MDYAITVNNNDTFIYIKVFNKKRLDTYEKKLIQKDILPNYTITEYYEYCNDCINENSISFVENEDSLVIKLCLSFRDIKKITHEVVLPRILINDDTRLTYKLTEQEEQIKELQNEVNSLKGIINELVNEEILLYFQKDNYFTCKKYSTEVDLSKFDNGKIIWNNLSRLPKLTKLIVNDTNRMIEPSYYYQNSSNIHFKDSKKIYQLTNKFYNRNETQINPINNNCNSIDAMNFLTLKELVICSSCNGFGHDYQNIGQIDNIPNLEKITFINFSFQIKMNDLESVKTLKEVKLINCKPLEYTDTFHSYCKQNNIKFIETKE